MICLNEAADVSAKRLALSRIPRSSETEHNRKKSFELHISKILISKNVMRSFHRPVVLMSSLTLSSTVFLSISGSSYENLNKFDSLFPAVTRSKHSLKDDKGAVESNTLEVYGKVN